MFNSYAVRKSFKMGEDDLLSDFIANVFTVLLNGWNYIY